MTTASDLRSIVDMLDDRAKTGLPYGPVEIAALAAEIEAKATEVERMEHVTGIAAATLALEAIEKMEAKARAARLQ